MIAPFVDVAELAFILYVLNILPPRSVVSFVSSINFHETLSRWRVASPIRRTRLRNNLLWSCIQELINEKNIVCFFSQFSKDSPPPYSVRAQELNANQDWSLQSNCTPLSSILPPNSRTMFLFTGQNLLLTQDPVEYWRNLSDIKKFFSLMGLSRLSSMTTAFHTIDWQLSFNNFKNILYPRNLVTKSNTFLQFRLKLWFDELPIMYRLRQRYLALYADDSLCPNCGTFMETLGTFIYLFPE
jgi:hypothetical protein